MEKASVTSSTASPTGEIDQVSLSDVMDVAGLILYDTEATPIRLKVLLDRLLSVLSHDQVLHVLAAYGWTYEDFCRGYKFQVRQLTRSFYLKPINRYVSYFRANYV